MKWFLLCLSLFSATVSAGDDFNSTAKTWFEGSYEKSQMILFLPSGTKLGTVQSEKGVYVCFLQADELFYCMTERDFTAITKLNGRR